MSREQARDAAGVRPGVWSVAALAVAALALVGRIHDAASLPPLQDFDGPGHALNVVALHAGRLPEPTSWGGFHPPIYYALGALVWEVLPPSVPVHVGLRWISLAAGVGLALWIWRCLRRRTDAADAALIALLVFCTPVVVLATSMLGNEALCAFLVTGALARTLEPPPAAGAVRHACVTGLWLAGALLTKATALAAVGACALGYAAWLVRRPRAAVAALAVVVALPLVAAAPHYARLLRASGGGVLAVVSGGALSPLARAEMRAQLPGSRHLSDYLRLPPASLLAPVYQAPGMLRSVPGLLYASTWADAHEQFLPASDPRVVAAEAGLALGGLLPTGLALAGLARVLRRPLAHRELLAPLALAAGLLVALLRYTWVFPAYSAVKASYLLSAALPAALCLSLGVGSVSGPRRAGLRGAFLALALACTLVTWHGWWAL